MATQKQVVNWDEVAVGWQQIYAEAGDRWREAFVPLMKGVIADQAGAQAIALGMSFDVRNLYAEKWFGDHTMSFASQVMGETERELAGLLQQAQREGWSIPTMQERMGTMFQQWSRGNLAYDQFDWLEQRMPAYRRELIARAETIRSSNRGINALYKNWGVQYKEWHTTEDERRCPWCAAMHGKIIPIDGTFWGMGDSMNVQVGDIVQSMTFNYEAVTTPPLHPNCRCCLLPWKPEWAEAGVERPIGIVPEQPLKPGELGRHLHYAPDPDIVMNAEQYAQRQIKNMAEFEGITEAEVIARIESQLAEDLSRPLSIRRGRRGSAGVVKDGRFKTQFETGTSGGFFSPDSRRLVEMQGLGAPEDLPDFLRPVYGYFSTDAHSAHHYGAVEFVLKEEVKDRTTYTIGDSLHHFGTKRQVGGVSVKSIAAWDQNVDDYFRWPDMISYIEAQIQGGVSLDDVAKVIIHAQPGSVPLRYGEMMEGLAKKGIGVTIDSATP